MSLIFLGNCEAGKYPLLRALNVALTDKSSGNGDDDDGGSCDPSAYSTTARTVVTRKPWVPTPLPPQDSNDVADSSKAPPSSGKTDRVTGSDVRETSLRNDFIRRLGRSLCQTERAQP